MINYCQCTFSIYSLWIITDPCVYYNFVIDSSRLVSNQQVSRFECDNKMVNSTWYRFRSNDSVDFLLANQCVPIFSCQTVSTGWMNGSHPTGKVQKWVLCSSVLHNSIIHSHWKPMKPFNLSIWRKFVDYFSDNENPLKPNLVNVADGVLIGSERKFRLCRANAVINGKVLSIYQWKGLNGLNNCLL